MNPVHSVMDVKNLEMNYLNLDEKKLEPVVNELNILLADYQLYYQKLRNFHWNITGKNFFDLHDKFEIMYTDARVKIDEIAERILTLGYHPLSNYSTYLEKSSINESPTQLNDEQMIEESLFAHAILLKQMSNVVTQANQINDEGTTDLVGAYIRELEKSSWMLNAWSKRNEEKFQHAEAS